MALTEFDLVVRTARAVTDERNGPISVGIRAGRIAELGPYDAGWSAARVVELAADEVLLPGLVDTHVHVNEPGRTHWEGFDTATRAAAAGGVTTLIDMPLNSIPPTVDVDALATKRAAAGGRCHVDVGFWGGAVPSNIGRLRVLHDAGVFGFKSFLLPSGVDEFPPLDVGELDAASGEVATFDGILIVHAEDARTVAEAPHRPGSRYADFLRSRPHQAEDIAIANVIASAARHRARAHVLHLSSAAAVPAIAAAREAGVRLTVETCPHYLTLAADDIADGQTVFKCCPPIRDQANSDRLWGALATGVVDCVVSDHSPSPPELKNIESGDFAAAWGGVSSLQLGLAVVWTEARRRGHGLAEVVRWMATRPAEVARVSGKGRIAPGYAADLVVFAPDEAFVVDPARLHHRHPLTPYTGRELTGVVRTTYLRGRPITGNQPAGQLLRRLGDPDA